MTAVPRYYSPRMVTQDLSATTSHSVDLRDVRVLRSDASGFPRALLSLPNPPTVIYIAGELAPADAGAVAVVGSRHTSPEAIAAATDLGRSLAERGRTVVSGLALGIDAAAHRGALAAPGGRTIAVVATGLDRTFPPEHLQLDLTIRQHGAVISPFPLGERASRASFLLRNELIAGLAVGSVIVVGDEHSGTRSEVNHTVAQRKPVLFWAPLMGTAPWAQQLVQRGLAAFVDDVSEVLERLPRPG